MRLRWKQTRVTAVVPLLVTLALIGAACGGTTTPGVVDTTSQSTNAGSVTGYEVGQQAPDFVLTLDDGQRATLASLRAENRPVVLYFFTTW